MLTSILKNYVSLTAIRVFSRVFDYFIMIYLIRQVISPQILANIVALQLILSLSLHITKQCFKPSYIRQKTNNDSHKQSDQATIIASMNLMSIGVLVTFVCGILICMFQWNQRVDLLYMQETIILFGLSGVFEALKQKYTVELTLKFEYTKIAIIELLSYWPKSILFFFAAKNGLFDTYGILLFGVGKISFYLICFLITFIISKHKSHFILKKIPNTPNYLKKQTKKVMKQLVLISFLKMILQQFQKIFLVMNHSVQTSSIYSLITHIGSIVVRYLFAPLQQIAYNFYSRGTQADSLKALVDLIKSLVYFAIICITFGFRYSPNLLQIVYKQKWVSDQSIHALNSDLILLSIMGINGSMQAFMLAKADHQKTIPKFKYFTIISSTCYFASSYILLEMGYGASSIFLGNAIGMAVRIIISWNLQIKKHINLSNFVKKILPNRVFVFLLMSMIYASYKINQYFTLNATEDFIVGVMLFGITCLPVLKQYWPQIRKVLKSKTKSQ